MNSRAEQRRETRERIVNAAIEVFSELGFGGAGTREIAARAGVNQGLLTYHFSSKEALWQASVGHIFSEVDAHLASELPPPEAIRSREDARDAIRAFVRFAARRPELFRLIVEPGNQPSERVAWLVDNHIRGFYEAFATFSRVPEEQLPHAFYSVVGAASIIFAVPDECLRLTGVDPRQRAVVERHADWVADLLFGPA